MNNYKFNRPLRALISGGGTGGHIFPALSIANELRRRMPDIEILFVGAENRMEMERVPAAGYSIKGLPVAGFDRKRLWRNIPVLFKLWKSMRMARSIVKEFKPDFAVGVGGYASGPVLRQAQKMGITTVIQEQNSYAGVTNKLLGKKADVICVAYDNMERFFPDDRIVLTGNPVRKEIFSSPLSRAEAKEKLGFDPQRKLIAVVGGSLGARTINEAMKKTVRELSDKGVSVLWQTGKLYADECMQAADGIPNVKATPFLNNMELVYAGADLLVSRAGASTISEIQIAGMPSVLIPSPNVAEDHQRKNAMALVSRNAAVMVEDKDAVDKLAETVIPLIEDSDRLKQIGDNVLEMARPHAAEIIVDNILEIIGYEE